MEDSNSAGAALKALIIEDDVTSRVALRAALRKLDFEVCGEAGNGRRGIQLAIELAPDLVCLDIGLPDLDGSAVVLNEIMTACPKARVVMVTGSSDRIKVRESLFGGAVGYIVKPYALNTIRATLARLFPDRDFS